MRVLITAGPTAVAIDPIRVITNMATGEIGRIFAGYFYERGFDVRLLLGGNCPIGPVKCRVDRFFFYDELDFMIDEALASGHWDVVVHAAAVSDFSPDFSPRKISSGDSLNLVLRPLPKLVKKIVSHSNVAGLVAFKLEDGLEEAINGAMSMLGKYDKIIAVVANTVRPYAARVIRKNRDMSEEIRSKDLLAAYITDMLTEG